MNVVKIGIIGCGNISSVYMNNIPKFNHLALVACADLDLERANVQAKTYNIPKACSVQALLDDPTIDLVINLTIPRVHAEVCIQVLQAGKHVYVEKPLATTCEEARHILEVARQNNLLVGCAPDTFLGTGIQTAIQCIDNGEIGTPIGASAFMINRGPEHWHPDPAFFYQKGGGPMFDMGPYYLTALIAMLGPIKRIAGIARASYLERTILSEPKAGEKITVNTPTHISGSIDFVSGAVASLTTSFDAFGGSSLPPIEIYGSEGTLILPDPNQFGGSVQLRRMDALDFVNVPSMDDFPGNDRGLGVADMGAAILNNHTYRANGELAFHVLEAMNGFLESSRNGKYYEMESTCGRPEPLPDQKGFFANE